MFKDMVEPEREKRKQVRERLRKQTDGKKVNHDAYV